jgi:DNA-binding XRE family transcriptional regulator
MDLSAYLKVANKTQAEFAAEVGTTAPTISRLIKGEFKPSLALAHEIERASGGVVRTEVWVGIAA